MPTILLSVNLSPDDMFHAAEQLDTKELDEFVTRHLHLRAGRYAPCLSREESVLLLKLNEGLPQEVWDRYTALDARREAHELTPEEQRELLQLMDRFDQFDNDRFEELAQLANLRQVTVPQLMKDLDIHPRGGSPG